MYKNLPQLVKNTAEFRKFGSSLTYRKFLHAIQNKQNLFGNFIFNNKKSTDIKRSSRRNIMFFSSYADMLLVRSSKFNFTFSKRKRETSERKGVRKRAKKSNKRKSLMYAYLLLLQSPLLLPTMTMMTMAML